MIISVECLLAKDYGKIVPELTLVDFIVLLISIMEDNLGEG